MHLALFASVALATAGGAALVGPHLVSDTHTSLDCEDGAHLASSAKARHASADVRADAAGLCGAAKAQTHHAHHARHAAPAHHPRAAPDDGADDTCEHERATGDRADEEAAATISAEATVRAS